MAAQGNTKLTYDGFASNKTALKSAVMLALQQRKWTVVSAGNSMQIKLEGSSWSMLGYSDCYLQVNGEDSIIFTVTLPLS